MILKNTAVLICSVLLVASFADAKNCKKGKACGNSCIAKDAVCTKEEAPAKQCKKGKPCGKTCIPQASECHAG